MLSAPELLHAVHNVSQFSCGKPSFDRWLKSRALANQQKGLSVVMVVHVAGRVVGCYGLAPMSVVPAALPRAVRVGQPLSPMPCILFGQLATDTARAGQGIGVGLLNHALARSVNGAALIGGRALMVNAIDNEATAFWRRRGNEAERQCARAVSVDR